jgi:hypothetical protein
MAPTAKNPLPEGIQIWDEQSQHPKPKTHVGRKPSHNLHSTDFDLQVTIMKFAAVYFLAFAASANGEYRRLSRLAVPSTLSC